MGSLPRGTVLSLGIPSLLTPLIGVQLQIPNLLIHETSLVLTVKPVFGLTMDVTLDVINATA